MWPAVVGLPFGETASASLTRTTRILLPGTPMEVLDNGGVCAGLPTRMQALITEIISL